MSKFLSSFFINFQKLLNCFCLFFLACYLCFFVSFTAFSQSSNSPLLLPKENVLIEPKIEDIKNLNSQNIVITILPNNFAENILECVFIAEAEGLKGEKIDNNQIIPNQSTVKPDNNSCKITIRSLNQGWRKVFLSVRVKLENSSLVYSTDINLTSSNQWQPDKNEDAIPRNLYLQPEIEIFVQKQNLQVGDTTKTQLFLANVDVFDIKNVEIEAKIKNETAVLNCNSFENTDKALEKRFVLSIPTFAEELVQAECIDETSFKLKIPSLENQKTTRINFDIKLQKEGQLEFDFITNLKQGKISSFTEGSNIKPKSENTEKSAKTSLFWWIGFFTTLILIVSAWKLQKWYYKN